MNRRSLLFAVLLLLVMTVSGFGQWHTPNYPSPGNQTTPRDGVCFYRDANFGGQSFCLSVGQDASSLPPGMNDAITSVRFFGNARAIVFENSNFSGPSEDFDSDIRDLHAMVKRDDSSRTWNDRISSVRIESVRRDWRSTTEGQRPPRDGACFYLDGNFSNRYFCLEPGQNMANLPPGFNDQITSIRIFGRARAIVFENSNFSGPSQEFSQDAPDLRYVRKQDDPSRVWNDRISSVQVEAGGGAPYRRGRQPRTGACFFLDGNFSGESVCLQPGESLAAMPAGFNDRITSIQIFGNARVIVYENSNFSGPRETFDRDVRDLREQRKHDDPSRTWSDRISSVQVEAGDNRRRW